MDVLVFTNSRKLKGCFQFTRKNSRLSLPQFFPRQDLKKNIKSLDKVTLVYLDLGDISAEELPAILRLLSRNPKILFGLIDPDHKLQDPAQVFFRGGVDYIGKSILSTGIDAKRLNLVIDCARAKTNVSALFDQDKTKSYPGYIPSGKDWRNVVAGQEYSFCLMFIELDGREEMEKKYGLRNLGIALDSFRSFIDNSVKPFHGRLWIWSRFGGIILFPFDGSGCPQLKCGFKLMLSKHLYDIEESLFPNFISFRLALHIGNTVFTRENTGNIISDSLNFIFHLGQQYAKPGQFYVSESVLHLGREELKGFFSDSGIFEGRTIYQMRLPDHGQNEV